jgi:hypothetical protein
MSERLLHRTVVIGGAAAIAFSAWLIGRANGVSASDADSPALSNVAVDCEPTQQALVRQVTVNGEPRAVVQCVSAHPADALVRGESGLASPALMPAVYRPAQPVRTVAPAPAPTGTPRAAPVERVTNERADPERSWKTRAMVIGGSAGAGAGIGALIGGKKGALIGAAVGGGGGTLYEVIKH